MALLPLKLSTALAPATLGFEVEPLALNETIV
jgi:hypothetical protein